MENKFLEKNADNGSSVPTNRRDEAKSAYFVQSIDRTLNILECFSHDRPELTLADLVKMTGLNRTTAHRILSYLSERQYLEYSPETKKYKLGLMVMILGGIGLSTMSIRGVAGKHLSKLCEESGHTVMMGQLIDGHFVFTDKREGTSILRLSTDIGWRRPPTASMFGLVIMAYLPLERQKELVTHSPLEKLTPYSLIDPERILEKLTQIARDGFCVGREHVHVGLGGVAAPIRDYTGQVVASVGMTMPVNLLDEADNEARFIVQITQTAAAISDELGYLKVRL